MNRNLKIFFGIVSLSWFLLFAHTGYAQNMSVGVKGGLNLSHMTKDINEPAFLMGVSPGLNFTYIYDTNYAITAELNFTMKGTKYWVTTNFNHLRLNYIELPILCQYYFLCNCCKGSHGLSFCKKEKPCHKNCAGFVPKVFIGPAVGYLIYAKDRDNDVKVLYKKVDLSLVGGIGFNKYMSKNLWLTFDTRYQLGLLDIRKDDNLKEKTGVLSFNLGLTYTLKSKEEEKK